MGYLKVILLDNVKTYGQVRKAIACYVMYLCPFSGQGG